LARLLFCHRSKNRLCHRFLVEMLWHMRSCTVTPILVF
jgi:hypothetical protein